MSIHVGPRGFLPAPSPEFSIHPQNSRISVVAISPTAYKVWSVPRSALQIVFNLGQTLLVDERLWSVVDCGVRCAIERRRTLCNRTHLFSFIPLYPPRMCLRLHRLALCFFVVMLVHVAGSHGAAECVAL